MGSGSSVIHSQLQVQIEVSSQLQAPAVLISLQLEKTFWYPMDRKLGGLQSGKDVMAKVKISVTAKNLEVVH